MTIKEFFEVDFRDFEEIKIYKNNDNTDDKLITHSCYYTIKLNNFGFVVKNVTFTLFLLFK